MNKQLLVSGLATVSVLMSGMAVAQGAGKVISSTPVTKKVTEPKTTCTNDKDGKEHCQTKSVTENRTVAYNVVYEYAGHKHTAQLPFQPGPTIELEVTPRALAAPAKAAAPAKPQVKAQTQVQAKPQPSYSAEPQPYYSAEAPRTYTSPPPVYSSQPEYSSQPTEVVERYVREPVYVEPAYYPRSYYYPSSYYSPRSYYYPSYYADPFYPIVGLALGYTAGRYGYARWGGHGHRHGHHGHRGPGRGR